MRGHVAPATTVAAMIAAMAATRVASIAARAASAEGRFVGDLVQPLLALGDTLPAEHRDLERR